jgi:BlaI family penicillinase repressor
MSPGKVIPQPTGGELEILQVLWRHGPATVRDVHLKLQEAKASSYNTTLKLLQIMHDKGLAARDESRRPQVYRATLPEEQMQRRIFADVLRRVFGGSARKLAAALTAGDVSPEELAEIRQLIGDDGKNPPPHVSHGRR